MIGAVHNKLRAKPMPISLKRLRVISFARMSYFSKRIDDTQPWYDVGNLGRCLLTTAKEIATPKTFSQSLKWVFFRAPKWV
jgi:hypothetical protein